MSDKQAPGGQDGGSVQTQVDVRSASGSFGGNGLDGAPHTGKQG